MVTATAVKTSGKFQALTVYTFVILGGKFVTRGRLCNFDDHWSAVFKGAQSTTDLLPKCVPFTSHSISYQTIFLFGDISTPR